jgi:hypothetical protein
MRKQKLTNLTQYAPGGVVILNCPIGPTYEKLKFNLLNGLLISHVDLVVGKINGKPFFTVKGADLQAENLYDGLQNPNTLMLFDFTQPNAKSSSANGKPTSQAAEMLLTCVPSALMQSLTFEISINGAAPAGGGLECYSQESDPTNNPFVSKQMYAQYSFPTAQDNDIALPVGQSGGIIKQLFFHQTNYGVGGAGAVTNVQVRNAGVIIFEAKPSDLAGDQTDYKRVPQAGLLVIDFYLQGLREKLLNTSKSNNVFVRLTTNGPTTWTGYTRLIDPAGR